MNYSIKNTAIVGACIGLSLVSVNLFADTQSLGTVASTIIGSLGKVTKLITALSYVTGLAFSIGAIVKFKQHKDNPAQIPIATPITLVGVSAALLFLPTILGVTGATLFGNNYETAGPSGTIFKGTS